MRTRTPLVSAYAVTLKQMMDRKYNYNNDRINPKLIF